MREPFGILDLLISRGFDPTCRVKLVRHQDRRFDVAELIRDGWFDLYQSTQGSDIFGKCDFIVSFTGDGGTRARLLGVYKVAEGRKIQQGDIPDDAPFADWVSEDSYKYDLKRQDSYADLEGRVVIEWGSATLSWHQHLRNKPIIEIFPPGRSLKPFIDYLDFSLTHAELAELMANPAAHRDWHSSLSAVAGVYLILASTTGDLYVGSACGLDGVWGRWQQYATNGHGGNRLLRNLVETGSNYPGSFRFSLLQVLPKTTSRSEVIRWESSYKVKLGTRAIGLNCN